MVILEMILATCTGSAAVYVRSVFSKMRPLKDTYKVHGVFGKTSATPYITHIEKYDEIFWRNVGSRLQFCGSFDFRRMMAKSQFTATKKFEYELPPGKSYEMYSYGEQLIGGRWHIFNHHLTRSFNEIWIFGIIVAYFGILGIHLIILWMDTEKNR